MEQKLNEDWQNNRGCFPFSEDLLPFLVFIFHMNEPAMPNKSVDWGNESCHSDDFDGESEYPEFDDNQDYDDWDH